MGKLILGDADVIPLTHHFNSAEQRLQPTSHCFTVAVQEEKYGAPGLMSPKDPRPDQPLPGLLTNNTHLGDGCQETAVRC